MGITIPHNYSYQEVRAELDFFGLCKPPADPLLAEWTHNLTETVIFTEDENSTDLCVMTNLRKDALWSTKSGWDKPFRHFPVYQNAMHALCYFVEFLKSYGWHIHSRTWIGHKGPNKGAEIGLSRW